MPSNNPVSKKEEARLVKHPGKRDRLVCATPPKSEFMLLSRTKPVEPSVTIRLGKDNVWRVWSKEGHLVGVGETKEKVEKLIV
jgi:hypothetical protein